MQIERWAFSAEELNRPESCHRRDRLWTRYYPTDEEGHPVPGDGSIIYVNRLGELLNAEELSEDAVLASTGEDSFGHHDPELGLGDDETVAWRNVIVSGGGTFISFV